MQCKQALKAQKEQTVIPLIPVLAEQIGMMESIVLMQLSHWIKITNHERDGKYWTYQTTKEMVEKAFSWSSVSTVNRAIKNLERAGYIQIEQKYNKAGFDRTRWYAINCEKVADLAGIDLVDLQLAPPANNQIEHSNNHIESSIVHNGDTNNQSGTSNNHIGATIPEITTETTSENFHLHPSSILEVPEPPPTEEEMKWQLIVESQWIDPKPGEMQWLKEQLKRQPLSWWKAFFEWLEARKLYVNYPLSFIPKQIATWKPHKAQGKQNPERVTNNDLTDEEVDAWCARVLGTSIFEREEALS